LNCFIVIDELSFYVYGVGCVIATLIAKISFQYTNRGQSLMFHEFIQSWVGYLLVKVFRAYGLQPRSLHPKLKQWSPDLFDVFTYLENKFASNKKQQNNVKRIIEVLSNRTKHNRHFAKV
jgi:hypothetical protein